jgi:polyhydroxyalkanoate synthesis regulator phasin
MLEKCWVAQTVELTAGHLAALMEALKVDKLVDELVE